jgi:DNA-binding NarL/FixJ family response regulator
MVVEIEPVVSRVLIIDDDAFAGSEVRALLVGEFHDAVLVKDAVSGILALASSRFDLVIVDILHAQMNGLALIARLRGLSLTLPIIGMIGVELSELKRPSLDFSDLAIEAGATCCLRRPLDSGKLIEAVNSNLGLSNNSQIVKLPPDVSAEIRLNQKVAILAPASESHELKEAFAVLRHYVQQVKHESGSSPYSAESVRDMLDCALEAIERACRTAESSRGVESGVRVTTDVIALGNRSAILQHSQSTSSGRDRLTPREREVLALVTDGVSNKVGGFRLSISVRTFETHRANVMGKLGARNAAELVRFGLEGAR